MKNACLRRFEAAHLLTVISEWAGTIGVLVHAYRWGGSSAVGLVSLAVLAAPLAFAPMIANLFSRRRAQSVRLAGFAVQAAAFGAATVATVLDLATPVVAIAVVMALGAVNTLRPTGAALLPVIARSPRELITGNLRTSHSESASVFFGPLIAASLEALGGSTGVFGFCAGASAVAFAATAWRPSPLVATSAPLTPAVDREQVLRVAVGELRERRWAIGVLGVASARNIVVGAFDVLMVIVASQALDMGESGSGTLWAFFGAGALLSTMVITAVVRRSRLSATLVVTLVIAASICIVLGMAPGPLVLYACLPLLGMCASLMDNVSRMLLQRSTDPRRLGPLFALVGLTAGLAQVVGSIIAQILIAVAGYEFALIGVGAVLAATAVATVRALRSADAHADVPVVEMALLGSTPMFSSVSAATLEAVARTAENVTVEDGEDIIRQGDSGDAFYAVVEGEFDILMNGEYIRSAPRGDCFGEVALLSNGVRTATVRAKGRCELLRIHRDPFLTAVTGAEAAHSAALAYVEDMRLEDKRRWTSEAARRREQAESARD